MDSVPPAEAVGQMQVTAKNKTLTGSDDRTRTEALGRGADSRWPTEVQRHGCRVAQKAFEVPVRDQKNRYAERLYGHIQGPFEESPRRDCVVQGCRVVELLEHCTGPQVSKIGQEVIRDAGELITHPFGNFAMQHVLKYGGFEDKRQIVEYLVRDIYILAKHRVACHVIEAALTHSSPEDRDLLIQALSADQAELALLAQTDYGSFVAREVMRMQPGMTL